MNFFKEMGNAIRVIYDYDSDSDLIFLEDCSTFDRDFDGLTVVFDPNYSDTVKEFIRNNIKQADHCLELFEKKPAKIFEMLLSKSMGTKSFTEAMVKDAGSSQEFFDKYVRKHADLVSEDEEVIEEGDVSEVMEQETQSSSDEFVEEDEWEEEEETPSVSEKEKEEEDEVELEMEEEEAEEEEVELEMGDSSEEEEEIELEMEEEEEDEVELEMGDSSEEEEEIEFDIKTEEDLSKEKVEFEEETQEDIESSPEESLNDSIALDIENNINEVRTVSNASDHMDNEENLDETDEYESSSSSENSSYTDLKTSKTPSANDNSVQYAAADKIESMGYLINAIAEKLDINTNPDILTKEEIDGLLSTFKRLDPVEMTDVLFKVLESMNSQRERAFITEILGKVIVALQHKGLLTI